MDLGGGGGKNTSELNFDVKAYSTEEEMLASNPGENTIGIVTDTPITGWEFYIAGSNNPIDGCIWINYVQSGQASFNAIKKNKIELCPTEVKQYINNEWVHKKSYIYKNGEWIVFFSATINITYPLGSTCTATDGVTTMTAPDTSGTWDCVVPNAGTWTVSLDSGFAETVDVATSGETYTVDKWHIFNGASDCTAVSGGWTAEAKRTSSDTQAYAARPEITQGSNYIKFSIGANQCGMVYTTNKVSLKGVKTIKVSGTLANAGAFDHSLMMTVWSSIGTYCDDNNAATAGTTPGTTANSLSLNVSSLSGSYYIGFKFNTRSRSGAYASITEFSLIC